MEYEEQKQNTNTYSQNKPRFPFYVFTGLCFRGLVVDRRDTVAPWASIEGHLFWMLKLDHKYSK